MTHDSDTANFNPYVIRTYFACTSLTSITIPDSVTIIGDEAFSDCTSLTSITFHGTITANRLGKNEYGEGSLRPFDGDLRNKYLAGGIGTYTRSSNGSTWTKQ